MSLTVAQLISILREMDQDADVCLAVDRYTVDKHWETELVSLRTDDLILGSTYAAFQVPDNEAYEE